MNIRIYCTSSLSAAWLVGRFVKIDLKDMKNGTIYFSIRRKEFSMIANIIEMNGYPIIEIEYSKYKNIVEN